MKRAKVVIVKTGSYDAETVDRSINKIFDLLGDDLPDLKGNILLKPNLVIGKSPGDAATTHPSVVKAIADTVDSRYHPGSIDVGDSPGGFVGIIDKIWDKTGLKKARDESCFNLVPFDTGKMENRDVLVKGEKSAVKIVQPVLDAGTVINMPKLKTHILTLYTGALKNIFGIIPGLLKTHLHKQFCHPYDFAVFIAQLNRIFQPDLHIMDAVIGMEGNGPTSGIPRPIGCILASTDPAALDAAAVFMLGIKPADVPHIRFAGEMGIGCIDIDGIEFPWQHPGDIPVNGFKWPNRPMYTRLPRFLYRIASSFYKTQPVMKETCIKCMKCAELCPVQAIRLENEVIVVDGKECISCFCCCEMCEYKAVEIKASWLAGRFLP